MGKFDDGQAVPTVAVPAKQIKQCKMRRERCHINKSTKELREETLLLSGIKQEERERKEKEPMEKPKGYSIFF